MARNDQDPEIVWALKSKAIYRVFKRGGRYTIIDHNEMRWVVERRPDEVMRSIKQQLSWLEDLLTA